MKPSTLIYIEHAMRPVLESILPHKTLVELYSEGRKKFLKKLEQEVIPLPYYKPLPSLERHLWGLTFRTPLMNAAGMFKNGECYKLMYQQGAGGYLGGTTTANSRIGNTKENIHLPFVPYPKSGAASNYLGLPNEGDEKNVTRVEGFLKLVKFPIGWSIMTSPDDKNEKTKLENLVKGMRQFEDAGIDFLEENKSCPNTGEGKPDYKTMFAEMRYVGDHFLKKRSLVIRKRVVPVVVKLSNDIPVKEVPMILDAVFEAGYDGVNFGNTSVNYQEMRERIHPQESALFDYFTNTFNGGVSGRPLKDKSLKLCTHAVNYLRKVRPSHEFHVIRTGGIESLDDIKHSDQVGVSLNQWFTGYWHGFALHGHDIHQDFFV